MINELFRFWRYGSRKWSMNFFAFDDIDQHLAMKTKKFIYHFLLQYRQKRKSSSIIFYCHIVKSEKSSFIIFYCHIVKSEKVHWSFSTAISSKTKKFIYHFLLTYRQKRKSSFIIFYCNIVKKEKVHAVENDKWTFSLLTIWQ
jgi:uncharacterized protein YozE (UPF0346 family)